MDHIYNNNNNSNIRNSNNNRMILMNHHNNNNVNNNNVNNNNNNNHNEDDNININNLNKPNISNSNVKRYENEDNMNESSGNLSSMESTQLSSNDILNGQMASLQRDVDYLKLQLKKSNNEKNLLEFKNQLLLDMLTLSTLDVKYFESLEKQWSTNPPPQSPQQHQHQQYQQQYHQFQQQLQQHQQHQQQQQQYQNQNQNQNQILSSTLTGDQFVKGPNFRFNYNNMAPPIPKPMQKTQPILNTQIPHFDPSSYNNSF